MTSQIKVSNVTYDDSRCTLPPTLQILIAQCKTTVKSWHFTISSLSRVLLWKKCHHGNPPIFPRPIGNNVIHHFQHHCASLICRITKMAEHHHIDVKTKTLGVFIRWQTRGTNYPVSKSKEGPNHPKYRRSRYVYV